LEVHEAFRSKEEQHEIHGDHFKAILTVALGAAVCAADTTTGDGERAMY
jgi:hypothetical protein